MFRYEIGATILVKRRDYPGDPPTQVKILAKAPNTIKVEVLDDVWWHKGKIEILTVANWFSVGRMKD